MARDIFDHAASRIVEDHIKVHDKMVPHPDLLKDAIAAELRTWQERYAHIAETWRSPYGGPRDSEVAEAIAEKIRSNG